MFSFQLAYSLADFRIIIANSVSLVEDNTIPVNLKKKTQKWYHSFCLKKFRIQPRRVIYLVYARIFVRQCLDFMKLVFPGNCMIS